MGAVTVFVLESGANLTLRAKLRYNVALLPWDSGEASGQVSIS